jgi:hypothetical protein
LPATISCDGGSLDSSHVGILHVDRERKQARSGSVDSTQHLVQAFGLTAVPKLEVRETEFGLDYAAIRAREQGSDDVLVRVTSFIMPNGFMIPPEISRSSRCHDTPIPVGC